MKIIKTLILSLVAIALLSSCSAIGGCGCSDGGESTECGCETDNCECKG